MFQTPQIHSSSPHLNKLHHPTSSHSSLSLYQILLISKFCWFCQKCTSHTSTFLHFCTHHPISHIHHLEPCLPYNLSASSLLPALHSNTVASVVFIKCGSDHAISCLNPFRGLPALKPRLFSLAFKVLHDLTPANLSSPISWHPPPSLVPVAFSNWSSLFKCHSLTMGCSLY